MKFRKHLLRRQENGFTIMELMIATLVFGVAMLVLTTAVIRFWNIYYKGITYTNTQDAARNVVNLIAQSIQFNGGAVVQATSNTTNAAFTSQAYCIGGQLYSYVLGEEVETSPAPGNTVHQGYHGVVVDNNGCTSSTTADDLSSQNISGGQELLAPNMRLTKLSVKQVGTTNLYQVEVEVVYGDDDLLCAPNNAAFPGDCSSITTSPSLVNAPASSNYPEDLSCKGFAGSQFCAVSDIATTVVKRIQ